MSRGTANTTEYPSDMHPDCPNCESDIFVDASKTTGTIFTCRYCGTEFGLDT